MGQPRAKLSHLKRDAEHMLAHARSQYEAVYEGDYDRESVASGSLIQAMENIGLAYYLARATGDVQLEDDVLALRGSIMGLLEDRLNVSFPAQYSMASRNPVHMVPEYLVGSAWIVETEDGTDVVPGDLVKNTGRPREIRRNLRPYVGSKILDYEFVERAVLARLSAPGYTDSTEWSAFKNIKEARDYIEQVYEIDPVTGEPFAEEGL